MKTFTDEVRAFLDEVVAEFDIDDFDDGIGEYIEWMRRKTMQEEERMKRVNRKLEEYDWLRDTGVDNWSNFSMPPDREDYDTEEEYQDAYDNAIYGTY